MDNASIEVASTIQQVEVAQAIVVELSDLHLAMIGGGIADVIGI